MPLSPCVSAVQAVLVTWQGSQMQANASGCDGHHQQHKRLAVTARHLRIKVAGKSCSELQTTARGGTRRVTPDIRELCNQENTDVN